MVPTRPGAAGSGRPDDAGSTVRQAAEAVRGWVGDTRRHDSSSPDTCRLPFILAALPLIALLAAGTGEVALRYLFRFG